MGTIALSIEELIYSFYSEGLFEQGNGLKQVYLEGVTEDQMDLLLRSSCRSMLAKDYLRFENHKFTLRPDVSEIIAALNHSERSVKASRHGAGGEEALSFHLTEHGTFRHTLEYDGQVHVFEKVEASEISRSIGSHFDIPEERTETPRTIRMPQAEFEQMLDAIEGGEETWGGYVDAGPAERMPFLHTMRQANGLLNTLAVMSFNDRGEPEVVDVLLFPHDVQDAYLIAKTGETFLITDCDGKLLRDRLLLNLGVGS